MARNLVVNEKVVKMVFYKNVLITFQLKLREKKKGGSVPVAPLATPLGKSVYPTDSG